MQLKNVPIDKAVGSILAHNVFGPDGHKALLKGRQLAAEDIAQLRSLGKDTVYVAILETDDVREDEAAAALANLVIKDGIPVLAGGPEDAVRRGTECLGCEYECWFRGKSAIKIDAPTPGLDEYRSKHGLPA